MKMPDSSDLLTLEGSNGKICVTDDSVKIELYKQKMFAFPPKWDSLKISKAHDIPRNTITNVKLVDILGSHQFQVYFPKAGFGGFVHIFISNEQKMQAEELIKTLNRIEPPEILKQSNAKPALDGEDQQAAGAWNDKGAALETQGKLDEAIQAFNKAIELNPNFALAWSNKALMLFKAKRYDEALEAVNKAIELNPKLAAAQKVKKLITQNPNGLSKNIDRILQRRGLSPNEVLIATEGANGQICLTEKGVIIGREGGIGNKLVVGFTKGEKFLPYRNIAGVQFKEPGMTVGYIQFTVPGGIESRGGAFDAVSDENTVTFSTRDLEIFRKIRDIVEERQGLGTAPIPQAPVAQIPPKLSIADELTKLAALKRDGAITDEEFEQLKKDLGLHP